VTPMPPSGAEPPEKIAAWTRRGNHIITGTLLGAGVVAIVAARYAVVPGQPGGWRYLAFALGICLILVLRARSFIDRYQSGVLAACATVTTLLVGTAGVAGAIDPPVVPPGPAPPDPAPAPDQPMRQVAECTRTAVLPGADLRELPPALQMMNMPAAWKESTGT